MSEFGAKWNHYAFISNHSDAVCFTVHRSVTERKIKSIERLMDICLMFSYDIVWFCLNSCVFVVVGLNDYLFASVILHAYPFCQCHLYEYPFCQWHLVCLPFSPVSSCTYIPFASVILYIYPFHQYHLYAYPFRQCQCTLYLSSSVIGIISLLTLFQSAESL